MKINMTKEAGNRESLIGHIVLHCMTTALMDQIHTRDDFGSSEGIVMDVVLTVDGHELDLKKFVDHWQNQIEDIINKEVKERQKAIFHEKFDKVSDLLTDLEERVEEEIEKRLDDWEVDQKLEEMGVEEDET